MKTKEEIRAYNQQYYKINSDRLKSETTKYRNAHKEEIKEYKRNYQKTNRERLSKEDKEYYDKNKSQILEQTKLYKNKKRKEDPYYRLLCNMRTRMYHAINGTTKKSARTTELLGCDTATLKSHLESQFTEGMTWDNYGHCGWHIDHIKPCASFDLTDQNQQRAYFNYTNLQPLWASDNLIKGSKLSLDPPT